MFEVTETVRDDDCGSSYPPDIDIDLLLATDPIAAMYAEDDETNLSDAAEIARLEASWADWARRNPYRPDRVWTEQDRPLCDRDPDTFTDSEALRRLVEVETSIAHAQALRAGLVALVAAQRRACDDRPSTRPGAAALSPADDTEAVPEVLAVSEWLSHELQMAHPYSRGAALDLVETSLILGGRLSATWKLLAAGRIDYPRARVLTDLLGTVSEPVAHTVEAMVLPKAPGLTPGGLATAVRRALTKVDALALRRRHARARKNADVAYWPTTDGMARLVADLPIPAAAACVDAIGSYARIQQRDGDSRPIGQIRAEILTDLILRPWDTTRPSVSGEVTIHLTLPADRPRSAGGNGPADADLDGHPISAAQCQELLGQLESSRTFLALHDQLGGLRTVATPSQLRRAARRTRRGTESGLGLPGPTDRYVPSQNLGRYVRTRDRTCRHFGCSRKAVHSDIDHHNRWPDGPTAACNLCSYCRTHHRLKHQAPGWTRQFQPDGTLTIHTPTGISRTTHPPGVGSGPDSTTTESPAVAHEPPPF